jgi:hypothetical protein
MARFLGHLIRLCSLKNLIMLFCFYVRCWIFLWRFLVICRIYVNILFTMNYLPSYMLFSTLGLMIRNLIFFYYRSFLPVNGYLNYGFVNIIFLIIIYCFLLNHKNIVDWTLLMRTFFENYLWVCYNVFNYIIIIIIIL